MTVERISVPPPGSVTLSTDERDDDDERDDNDATMIARAACPTSSSLKQRLPTGRPLLRHKALVDIVDAC